MELSAETIDIIRNLFRKRRIGNKHTEEKNCLRWLKNLPKDKQKIIREEWEGLVKAGWIIRMIKAGELHVSLNPRFIGEIMQVVEHEKR